MLLSHRKGQRQVDPSCLGCRSKLADEAEWYEVGSSEPVRRGAVLASFGGDVDFEIEATLHDVVANDEHTIALIEAESGV